MLYIESTGGVARRSIDRDVIYRLNWVSHGRAYLTSRATAPDDGDLARRRSQVRDVLMAMQDGHVPVIRFNRPKELVAISERPHEFSCILRSLPRLR